MAASPKPQQTKSLTHNGCPYGPGGAAMTQGVLTLTFALAMVIGNLGAGFVAENMGWMWVPVLMALFCGLALAVGLRGRRIRDLYLVEVAGEKQAEAANRVLGSS